MSRFIPNSFQIPNSFVDEYLDSLSGKAIKCYLLIARKTTGWRKDSDRISTSQFMAQCGIKDRKTAYAAIEELESVNLVNIERKQGEINEFSLNFFIDENNDFKPAPKIGTLQKTILKTIYKITPLYPPKGNRLRLQMGKSTQRIFLCRIISIVRHGSLIAECVKSSGRKLKLKIRLSDVCETWKNSVGEVLIWLGRFWINLSPTPTLDYLL
ncbi:TPA: replication protein [Haemophilus influenzae]|uniref:replication protein n=1 Tax=Haemophilus influenzae TaxID=727 RepID=UPI000ACEF61B|nr:replication protein [Haemophilus influenzae]